MAQTILKVSVGGREIVDHCTKLQIRQSLGEATLIAIQFVTGAPPRDVGKHFSDMLGKPLAVELQRDDASGRFECLVAQASVHDAGYEIVGRGPLYGLTQGRRSRGFVEQSPKEVLQRVLRDAGVLGEVSARSSMAEDKVGYLAQAGETDFGFLGRVAAQAGLVVLERGMRVVVSEVLDGPSLELSHTDLTTLRVVLEPAAVAMDAVATNYSPHGPLAASVSVDAAKADSQHGTTVTGSLGKLFPGSPAKLTDLQAKSSNLLTDQVRARAREAGTGSIRYEFTTHRPDVMVGTVLGVSGHASIKDKLMVVSIVVDREFTNGANPSHGSKVVAIPKGSLGSGPLALPRVGAVAAIVTENEDPDKLGRVRLKFPWDEKPTAWARVVSVSAGAKHGAFWVPQVEDEVLVEFEFGDPSRPVVVGSLYHSDAPPQVEGGVRDVLLARTTAGTEIRITQADNSEEISLRVRDNGPVVRFLAADSAKISIVVENGVCEVRAQTLHLTADDVVTIEGSKLSFRASDSISMEAQSNVTISGNQIKLN